MKSEIKQGKDVSTFLRVVIYWTRFLRRRVKAIISGSSAIATNVAASAI